MELLVVGNRTFRDKSPVMPAQLQPLAKLNEYAGKVREAEYGLGVRDVDEDYAHRLTKSLESLQHQVKQHEAALEKVSNLNEQNN